MQTIYPDTQLFIAGNWVDGTGGRTIPVFNPATDAQVGRVAYATPEDLDRVLASAEEGFQVWRRVPAVERAAILRRAASLLRERVESIAYVMTVEQGKPLSESRIEILAGADIIDWFAGESQRVYGRVIPPRAAMSQQLVLKQPIGVVAAFTPWNFPINQIVRKLSAALTTGCACIVKAPEETPASPAELIRAFSDSGVPAGVISLVFGDPAQISEHLIASPVVRKITFTGSTPVGKHLASLAGRYMKRVTMELGGHAPVIVAEDANVETAAEALTAGKFRNAGQVCISPTRFLVHNSIRSAFTKAFVKRTEKLRISDGLLDGAQMGALANDRRLEAMSRLVTDAVQRGASIETGGERLGQTGNFFRPTVLADVPVAADLFNHEPFGPVAAIRGFDSLDEAVREANRLPFGLAAYGFTGSIGICRRLSEEVEAGMLWVNQPAVAYPELPFGGMKDSGFGSEGGPEALEPYLLTKSVAIRDA